MATSLGSLFIDLRANAAGFESDMGRAARIAQKEGKELARFAAEFETAARAGILAGVGIAALAVKGAIDRADDLDELIQKVGGSAESLSRLQFGAQFEGVEDITGALVKLSKAAQDAQDDTSGQAAAFAALGIDTKDAAGQIKTADILIREIAGAFGTAEDGIAKTNIALALFGKSGADLIPFLNNGAEGIARLGALSDQLGATLSQQVVDQARQVNDNLFTLGAASRGAGAILAAELLPTLTQVSGALVDNVKDSEALKVAARGIGEVFKVVVVIGSEIAFVFKGIGTEIGGMAAQIAALAQGDFAGFSAIGDLMKADAAAARKAQDEFTAGILAGSQKIVENEAKTAADLNLIFDQARGEREKAYKDQLKAAEKFAQDMAVYNANLLQADSDENDGVRNDIAGQITKLVESLKSPTQQYTAALDELDRLRARAAGQGTPLDPEVYAAAVTKIEDDFKKLSQNYQGVTEEISEFSLQAARNMQSAFADFLFDPFEDGLNGLLRNFTTILQRMAAEAAAANIFNSIGGINGLAGLFGGIGSQPGGISTAQSPYSFAPEIPTIGAGLGLGAKSLSRAEDLQPGGGMEINIYASESATVNKRTGGDGREITDIMIGAVSKDIAEGGKIATTLRGVYGLSRRPGGG